MKTTQKIIAQQHAIDLLNQVALLTTITNGRRKIISAQYGNEGGLNPYPISGGICEHWPRDMKDWVTQGVIAAQEYIEESLDLWKQSGKQRATWLRKKNEILG